jgi:hypothetical protein
MDFQIPTLSSNRFSILTLRQAQDRQGERIEKHGFDTLPPSGSGRGEQIANGVSGSSRRLKMA